LALPVAVVESPDLTRETLSGAVLAGGTIKQFSVYSSEVEWNGAWKPVLISAVGQEALIGMRLLQGCQLSISVEPDGDVQIAEIS